jgi:putative transposase
VYKQKTRHLLNNRAEDSHQPFSTKRAGGVALQTNANIAEIRLHSAVHNHFNQERHLYSRENFKLNRAAALAEWRQLGIA